ncbi:uncharacterized protein BP01DRAFT_390663 [Aspergillus saccharolyticus JOP 1030-1]|uniref:Uncharacterized protein n=1 Tax=Aspergillus saccharolyticus JOP 1030-1 TaxID=1450539 RepID=A0A319AK68_9EURO|nr:hypothetical protein BP01DRAFT_390663 [Aspergillus saccharolyticus JOP 1030-1]PYH47012.1 hypothetical protein BP01DRAFT_390663 [Aspergillus saccharolyticus JOP 1030-1]
MPPMSLHYPPPPPRDGLTEREQGQVAQLFMNNDIPYVYLLAPSIDSRDPDYNTSSWVIPDNHFNRAVQLLKQKFKLPSCKLRRDCAVRDKQFLRPLADYHFHSTKYPTVDQMDALPISTSLDLYKKSSLLWMYPDPPIGAVVARDSYYMARRFPKPGLRSYLPLAEKLPVTVLTFPKYVEAFIMLACRDSAGYWSFKFWIDFLLFLRRYEQGSRQRDPSLAQYADNQYPLWRMEMIAEPYREYYKRLVYYDHDRVEDDDCGTQNLRMLHSTLCDLEMMTEGDGHLLWCCWGRRPRGLRRIPRARWKTVRSGDLVRPQLDLQRLGTDHQCVHKLMALGPGYPLGSHSRCSASSERSSGG